MKAKDLIKALSIAAKSIGTSSTFSRMQHSQDMDQQFQDAGLRDGPPPKPCPTNTPKSPKDPDADYWDGVKKTR